VTALGAQKSVATLSTAIEARLQFRAMILSQCTNCAHAKPRSCALSSDYRVYHVYYSVRARDAWFHDRGFSDSHTPIVRFDGKNLSCHCLNVLTALQI
jgi:hypothetical protein